MAETNWEGRYQVGDTEWDKGEAAPGLLDFLKENPLPSELRVAVPGCGFGYDVAAWAKAGVAATGFDLAPSAVKGARERHQHPLATFEEGNFLEDTPAMPFDWLFEHTLYCAIDPARREDYVKAAIRWLKPEGQFLAVHYMIPDEDGPPFGTNRTEIMERFSPHFELLKSWVPRSYPNRTGLEEMFLWRKK